MKIIKNATSGTYESSDLFVKVSPKHDGLSVEINSEVFKQFGDQITMVVTDTLNKLGVEEGLIIIEDKGALDCIIRARVQAAILRSVDSNELDWEAL